MLAHPDTPDFATVASAFRSLRPESTPAWGRMGAPEMVEHCLRFNETYLGRVPVPTLTRVLARLFGGAFIRKFLATSPFEMRRGMRTLPTLRVDPQEVDGAAFDDTRNRLLGSFDEIARKTGRWDHPLYGPLDAAVGQALVRHHAAHHLHQFGVL